jgi:hypothetical protein
MPFFQFFSVILTNISIMNPKDELKAVLIHTIVLQLQILNPEKYKLGIGRQDKILLEILSADELEGIIQIYENQINAMILARKTKLIGERLQPDHYCNN